jgi:hypothetical protein
MLFMLLQSLRTYDKPRHLSLSIPPGLLLHLATNYFSSMLLARHCSNVALRALVVAPSVAAVSDAAETLHGSQVLVDSFSIQEWNLMPDRGH